MRIDNPYLIGKMFQNMYKSGFSPVRQDLSGKFGCPVRKLICPVRLSPTFRTFRQSSVGLHWPRPIVSDLGLFWLGWEGVALVVPAGKFLLKVEYSERVEKTAQDHAPIRSILIKKNRILLELCWQFNKFMTYVLNLYPSKSCLKVLISI